FCRALYTRPNTTLYPYTTLCRSGVPGHRPDAVGGRGAVPPAQQRPDPLRDPEGVLLERGHGRIGGQRAAQQLLDPGGLEELLRRDRKSTRLNSSHVSISYAVFSL